MNKLRFLTGTANGEVLWRRVQLECDGWVVFESSATKIRRWRDGQIPDIDQAVGSPVRLTEDVEVAKGILALLPSIPTPMWGRDEFQTGEMWNRTRLSPGSWCAPGSMLETIHPPANGRAPGWEAGLAIAAQRSQLRSSITAIRPASWAAVLCSAGGA